MVNALRQPPHFIVNNPLKTVAILGLILAFSLSIACANATSDDINVVVDKGGETRYITLKNGKNLAQVVIPSGTLDAYMAEKGIESVTLTVNLLEYELVVSHN